MTVLSQVTEVSIGDGICFYIVQFVTVVLPALAANTSFGGLTVLGVIRSVSPIVLYGILMPGSVRSRAIRR
ncbi:hypothetical protein [Kibdelosporangium aridum]|uniref:hypothetical protein n=1 Tax=Kibdelosporangium aridum TaxID=2030 RepID=UPI0005260A73